MFLIMLLGVISGFTFFCISAPTQGDLSKSILIPINKKKGINENEVGSYFHLHHWVSSLFLTILTLIMILYFYDSSILLYFFGVFIGSTCQGLVMYQDWHILIRDI